MNTPARPPYRPHWPILRLICLTAALVQLGNCDYAWSDDDTLDLADTPLFAASNVKPNVLVAVDDSGSMDFETLFPTTSGMLFWNPDLASTWNGTDFVQDGNDAYAYLFPNGFLSSDKPDGLVYSNYYFPLPPIPAMAFARSPAFNTAYFNPAVKYDPWIGKAPADPQAAYYDPQLQARTLDLTQVREAAGNGYTFRFWPGMTIPADTRTAPKGGGPTDFSTRTTDETVLGIKDLGVSYFPATFYLPQHPKPGEPSLPADYGWRAGAATLNGFTPDGTEKLLQYKIKSDNFTSDKKYQAAIQNFANWFTYYRKRHLATRGGIIAAFDQIDGLRVGNCTINQPHKLTMRDIDNATDRQAFYNSIFGIDFSHNYATPNRSGLRFLGDQLEDNSDIIQSPCQKNFAILFTDGYNSVALDKHVGNTDGDNGPPFADDVSNTIADVAMKYYESLDFPDNIAPGKMGVPAACDEANHLKSLDCEKNPHMVTFGITLGQQGTLYNPDKNQNPYAHPPNWPNPGTTTQSPKQIDDLWHATVNTRGALLNATTPQQVANKFAAALSTILSGTGSASALAANSSSMSSDSVFYQASFRGGSWNGELAAYSTANATQGAPPLWRASSLLTHMNPDERMILTSIPRRYTDRSHDFPVAFRPDLLPDTADNAKYRAQIAYIRGDRSKEEANGGSFRNRGNNILGDIVHSSPIYAGAPDRYRYSTQWQDLRPDPDQPKTNMSENTVLYSAFAQQYAKREPMVYVGANDGMLHGFDADTGEEKLAYIPGSLLLDLTKLTDPDYIHRYYVDGSPAVGDVVYADDNGDEAWHTVLVSGLRNGGRSIFALDVTDPPQFSESDPNATVLWEYTDPDLGKTFGKPSIVRLHNGEWAAMFGNGYNSDHRCAALYLVDIKTGELIKNMTASDVPGNSGHCHGDGNTEGNDNGLSAPFPVDLDGDFITDYAYAGDLDGHLWKFDLTSTDPANWSVTKLFTATEPDNDDIPQPITTQPQVGVHPYGKNYGVMVYFGTGKYLEKDDAQRHPSIQNSLYGIWDPDVFTADEANRGSGNQPVITRDTLTRQRVIQDDMSYRVVSNNPVNYQQESNDSDKRGWELDLPGGELIISNPRLQGNTVSFSTTIPSVQSCTAAGSGYFMVVDAATGGRTGFPAFDLNGDHLFNSSDTVAVEDGAPVSVSGIAINNGAPGAALHLIDRAHEDDQITIPSTDGKMTRIEINNGQAPDRRRSWREIRR